MLGERLDCPIARQCGGCSEIGTPYGEQLQLKRERVGAALAAHPELARLEVEPCIAAPRRAAYRNRAKLAVREVRGRVLIGLHRRGSSQIFDLAPCRVQRRVLQQGIEALRGWLAEHRLARPHGPVFYRDLRESVDDGYHATLVVDRPLEQVTLPLDALDQRLRAPVGVALNAGNPRSSYPMGPETRVVRGPDRFLAPLGDRAFEVPPAGFFQVAPAALAEVHEAMAGHLAGAASLLDLYCGVGVHGIAVADRLAGGVALSGFDASPELVEAAGRNAERHGVAGARFVAGRVEERLDELPAAGAVILNPGRAGCHPGLLEWIGKSPLSKLAYLSCNPVTLARDLVQLAAAGFEIKPLEPVDLMPQTDQVEVLALLER
jgi:23S rRNA (uracil-5-)-methyltransferase RumA